LEPTAPQIGTITQPDCGDSAGSVVLTGLPASGDWIIYQTPGDTIYTGSGESTTISNLAPGTYTFKVKNAISCSDASGTGLTGEYYEGKVLDNNGATPLYTQDDNVDFYWKYGAPTGLAAYNNKFSIRWTGTILACYDETYTFYTTSDDGVRLYVNDSLIIDEWHANNSVTYSEELALKAGEMYDVVLEYYENGGAARIEFYWESSSQSKEAVPQTQLYPSGYKEFISEESASVTINDAPVNIYTVSGGGTYCLSSESISVTLSGSQTDVSYQLYNNGVAVGSSVSGTGSSITFSNIVSEGTYTVTATHATNGCSTEMNGSAVIIDETPEAPTISSVTQPTCSTPTGSVTLSNLPSGSWKIASSIGDTVYSGSGSTTTITGLEPGTYTFYILGVLSCPGNGTGLTAEYFDWKNTNTESLENLTPVLTQVDSTIDFVWTGAPNSSVNANYFSVRWSGQIQPCYSETYTFRTRSDDGIRLWVNNEQIINNWTNHSSTYNTGNIDLESETTYDIVLEFYDNTGSAIAELEWSSDSQEREIIPKSQLYPSSEAVSSSCTSEQSDEVVIVSSSSLAETPDSVSVSRNNLCPNDPDDITLTAYGGAGSTLKWFTDSCGGTQIGTDTSLTIASPTTTTTYYALWETDCGQSECKSVTVVVEDTEAPVANCKSEVTIYLDENGEAKIDTSTLNNGSTDNCGIDTMWVEPDLFDCDDISSGENTSGTVYSATISASDGSYSVTVKITDFWIEALTTETSECQYGFDYYLYYNYVIEFSGSGAPSSLDNCDLMLYFDNSTSAPLYSELPETEGSGTESYYKKIYRSNSDCATFSFEDLNLTKVDIRIQGTNINYQTVTMELTTSTSSTQEASLIVQDVSGARDTCSSTITVLDTVAPKVVCQADVYDTITGTAIDAGSVNLGFPTISDMCGVVDTTYSIPDSFKVDSTYYIVWIATDASGNTGSCIQKVTIVKQSNFDISIVDSTIGCNNASGEINYSADSVTTTVVFVVDTFNAVAWNTSHQWKFVFTLSFSNGGGRVIDFTSTDGDITIENNVYTCITTSDNVSVNVEIKGKISEKQVLKMTITDAMDITSSTPFGGEGKKEAQSIVYPVPDIEEIEVE
jgi:hypothetical protein